MKNLPGVVCGSVVMLLAAGSGKASSRTLSRAEKQSLLFTREVESSPETGS